MAGSTESEHLSDLLKGTAAEHGTNDTRDAAMNQQPTYMETLFDLFVPVGTDHYGIDAGSAIVAGQSQRGQERRTVHYESNRFKACNIVTLEDRCLHAAGRAAMRYPTIAQASLPRSALRHVGTFDLARRRITEIHDPEQLRAWIGQLPVSSEAGAL